MDAPRATFRQTVGRLTDGWMATGLPSRQGIEAAAETLQNLRVHLGVPGLWAVPPTLVTATLDDGLGQGLAIIERFAAAIGMRLVSLGLMQSPAVIIDTCRRMAPDYVGLTVLQFDTEAQVSLIAAHLPGHTRIVAGGPVFAADPDFAGRAGVHYAARNVADFLRFMLEAAGDRPCRPLCAGRQGAGESD